jgi:hypothetical protein
VTRAYSSVFFAGPVPSSAGTFPVFTVPPGRVWVVRDFAAWSATGGAGDELALIDDTNLVNIFIAQWPTGGVTVNQEARWVFAAGTVVIGYNTSGAKQLRLCGYDLSAT